MDTEMFLFRSVWMRSLSRSDHRRVAVRRDCRALSRTAWHRCRACSGTGSGRWRLRGRSQAWSVVILPNG